MSNAATPSPTTTCTRCGHERPQDAFRVGPARRRLATTCWLCRYLAARTPRARARALPPNPFDGWPRSAPDGQRLRRTCPRCRREQPIAEFYLHRATGRRASHCRACAREYSRRRYAADPQKAKAIQRRAYLREDPEQRRRRNRRYAAQSRARNAVRARTQRLRVLGVLTLAERCEDCGRPPALIHHETYGDLATLHSLCRPCHMRRHWRQWRKAGGGPVKYFWEYQTEE